MEFDLEQELKRALHREDASPDFTDRVMARIAERNRARAESRWWQRVMEFFQPARVKWAMALAAAFLLVFATIEVHRYRAHRRAAAELAEGERAKEQVMLAMRIASAKLNIAHKKVVGSR